MEKLNSIQKEFQVLKENFTTIDLFSETRWLILQNRLRLLSAAKLQPGNFLQNS